MKGYTEFTKVNEARYFKHDEYELGLIRGDRSIDFAFGSADVVSYCKWRDGTQVVDEEYIFTEYDPYDFRRPTLLYEPGVQRAVYYELRILKGGRAYVLRIKVGTFMGLTRERRRTSDVVERRQVVGFACTLPHTQIGESIDREDFASVGDVSAPADDILDPDDVNYIKGIVQFKDHLEEIGFPVVDVVYKNADTGRNVSIVKSKIREIEARAESVLGGAAVEPGKSSTVDVFLFDRRCDGTMFDGKIIVPAPSPNETRNGVCYLIPEVDVLGHAVLRNFDARTAPLGDIEHVHGTIVQFLGTGAPRFVQVSLKKSREGSQLGKVTRALDYSFPPVDESFLGNLWSRIRGITSGLFNRLRIAFRGISSAHALRMDELTSSVVRDLVTGRWETGPVREAYRSGRDIEEFRTGMYEGCFLIVNQDRSWPPEKFGRDQQSIKLDASERIDDMIHRLLTYLIAMAEDATEYDRRMAHVTSGAIMGATDLPIYKVYSYEEGGKSYSLHKGRRIKEESQVANMTMVRNEGKPVYIARIRNYFKGPRRTGDHPIYRSMDLYVYNYRKVEAGGDRDYYLKIRFGTGSSSHNSFNAEALPPLPGEVEEILRENADIITRG